MILETVCVGPLGVNCYILASKKGGQAIIIDPGAEAAKIKGILKQDKLKAAMVVNTHGHFDHIGCDDKFAVPVYIHKDDLFMLKDPRFNFSIFAATPHSINAETYELKDNQIINLEDLELKVIHTPGHSRGGTCLLLNKPVDNVLFSGDTLFCGGIGRADFPGASESMLLKSIRDKLLVLPDDTKVYPGHGPASTIGREKRNNIFIA